MKKTVFLLAILLSFISENLIAQNSKQNLPSVQQRVEQIKNGVQFLKELEIRENDVFFKYYQTVNAIAC